MFALSYLSQAAFSACIYGAIYYAWWRLVRRHDAASAGTGFQLLLASTLMWAQIFCVILVLGLAGVLYGSLALAINAGITGFVLWITRGPAQSSLLRPDLRELVTSAPVAVSAGVLIFLWFAVVNVIYPTGSYDDFVYHVPSAAYFVQHHSFALVEVPRVQSGINQATKLSELFCVWQYFLTRDDQLIDFWALGMFLQYLIAVYGLCRELGSTLRGAVFGTLLSAVAPVLLFQMLTAQNDLSTCAFFATALRFAVATFRGRWQRIGLAIAAGLLLSSKLTAPLLCAIVFIAFWIAEMTRSPRSRFTSVASATAWMGGIAILLGCWWYLRNTREFGNPFYPYRVDVPGIHLPGRGTTATEMAVLNKEFATLPMPVRLWRLWREEKSHYGLWLYNTDSAYGGFGPLFFVLGIPSLAIASVLTVMDRRWLAASVLWMIAGAYLSFSGNIAPRLSLFILPAVAIAMATMLDAIETISSVFATTLKSVGLGLVAYTFVAAAMSPYDPISLRTQVLSPRQKDFVKGTFLVYFANVREAIPRGATVAYDASTNFIWPLWRTDWGNQLFFIPTSEGWNAWSAKAAALTITHVVIGRPDASPLSEWARQHPEHFRPVAEGPFGALYSFRR